MRLIDTHTHVLLEPWKAADKEYAILSHTWGAEEVIFQEWEQLFPSGAIKGQCPHVRYTGIGNRAGYHKVMQACEQAKRDGIRWLWCDTMCINKESSAELSEAINSMFKWYSEAKICYVYLTDVTLPDLESHLGIFTSRSNIPGWFSSAREFQQHDLLRKIKPHFLSSRWWTRGWTLQELLAPLNVVFFAKDWTPLGQKEDLAPWISASTKIHQEALENRAKISTFSIAQRMSWAADRKTTIIEDMTYCLLGIFGINMPMLYGQGEHAFRNLQKEIIKISDDQSIFSWSPIDTAAEGALARSPAEFQGCGSIIPDDNLIRFPYSLTNLGLKMKIPIIPDSHHGLFFLGLNCSLELKGGAKQGRSNNQSATRRRFQAWIVVRRCAQERYERVHMPKSVFYFQSAYPISIAPATKDIFVISPNSTKPEDRSLLASPNRVPKDQKLDSSGIMASIGFGNMRRISRAYLDIWSPREFVVASFGTRQPGNCSHELVASGSFLVIFSVAWDAQDNPCQKLHTILNDPGRMIRKQIFDRLMRTNTHNTTFIQSIDSLDKFHKEIRATYATVIGSHANEPLIFIEDESLQDYHGRAEVVVEIIFTEKHG
ncbi:putative Heterokaryon incompatibility domain-containing protein [Seiridium cardinale]|uniref:Heterokaryon incompatibility domain-containing protein n=1 Tax=Seiridium cardinale TaxID=138064 RepID=A0ABR2Y5I6_9PEZI